MMTISSTADPVRSDAYRVPAGPEVTIVVPTYNESGNITPLVEQLAAAMGSLAWEVLFVDDDSPDGTAELVKSIASYDPRVRCIRRIGRRGLAGACLEGMLASSARFVAVMDADLQHDEALLPRMLATLLAGEADLVVGSRYAAGGSAKRGSFSAARLTLSQVASSLARWALGSDVSDPMSGFFMMPRALAEDLAPKLTTGGFKIMFDILAVARTGGLRVKEIPYVFRARRDGESKFDVRAALDFFWLLSTKLTGGRIPPRIFAFALVGASGIAVHLLVLRIALSVALPFTWAQAAATLTAMTSNFALNNSLTYRDRRLTGRAAAIGWLRFCATCSVGALSNVGVAGWLYASQPTWWLAGLLGSLVGAFWNFAVSSLLVWSPRAPRGDGHARDPSQLPVTREIDQRSDESRR